MAWATIAGGTNNSLTSHATLSQAVGAAVAAGDRIMVLLQFHTGETATGGVVTCTGVTWGKLLTSPISHTQRLEIWEGKVTEGGTPTVQLQYTPTPGTSTAGNASLNVDPFSGSDAASGIDGTGASQEQVAPGTGTDAVTSGTWATAGDGDLIYGGCADMSSGNDPGTVGTGFTLLRDSGGVVLTSMYRVQSAAGSIAVTLTATTGGNDFLTGGVAITPAAAVATNLAGLIPGTAERPIMGGLF